jgi:hypothetical protein
MENYKKLTFAFLLTLLFQLIIFAQDPGDFGDDADLNPTDTPINSQLWILIAIGLGFALLKTKLYFQKK